jgi:hypothetical protein
MGSKVIATKGITLNFNVEEKLLKQKYQSLMERTGYSIGSDRIEADIAV